MAKTVLVFKLGRIDKRVLQLFAHYGGVEKIVTSYINEQAGSFKTNLAYVGSLFANYDTWR